MKILKIGTPKITVLQIEYSVYLTAFLHLTVKDGMANSVDSRSSLI